MPVDVWNAINWSFRYFLHFATQINKRWHNGYNIFRINLFFTKDDLEKQSFPCIENCWGRLLDRVSFQTTSVTCLFLLAYWEVCYNNSPITGLQQQSYSGLRSPGRSNSTYFWNDSWVQTFHSYTEKCADFHGTKQYWANALMYYLSVQKSQAAPFTTKVNLIMIIK